MFVDTRISWGASSRNFLFLWFHVVLLFFVIPHSWISPYSFIYLGGMMDLNFQRLKKSSYGNFYWSSRLCLFMLSSSLINILHETLTIYFIIHCWAWLMFYIIFEVFLFMEFPRFEVWLFIVQPLNIDLPIKVTLYFL